MLQRGAVPVLIKWLFGLARLRRDARSLRTIDETPSRCQEAILEAIGIFLIVLRKIEVRCRLFAQVGMGNALGGPNRVLVF